MGTEENRSPILEPQGTEIATAAGGARRYRKLLKHIRWCDIKALLGESFDAWNKHNAVRLGASVAFYSLLSLAPLVLISVSIVGLVFGHEAAQRTIIQHASELMGPAGAKAIAAFLESSRNTTHGVIATVVGVITLLFSASGVLIELQDALNTIWEIPSPSFSGLSMVRSYIKQRLFSFAIVLAIGFLLIVSLAISAWIAALGAFSQSLFPGQQLVLHVVNFVLSFVILAGLFAAIYKIMPSTHIEWRDVILGGAVTSALFALGKLVLGIYLGRASYASVYGAAGSIVVLIAWVYYSGQIFFLGAEFTRAFANRYGSRPAQHPEGMVKLVSNTAAAGTTIVKP